MTTQEDWEEISRQDRLKRAVDHILTLPDPTPEDVDNKQLLEAVDAALFTLTKLRQAIVAKRGE